MKRDYSMKSNSRISITAEMSGAGLCSLRCGDGGGEGGRGACGAGLVVGVLRRGTPKGWLKEWKETQLLPMGKWFPC